MSGAVVTGAYFYDTTSRGFTKEQLYSTASYQENNLRGIGLVSNDLSGWNFKGQNLVNANLSYSSLTTANLGGANLASHVCISALTGANLSVANLANADLSFSTLTNANLSGAVVTGACVDGATSRGFTKQQLYSTASYQEKNLRGIGLVSNDLSGWDFEDQNWPTPTCLPRRLPAHNAERRLT